MSIKFKQISMVNKCRICLGDDSSMIDIFIPEIFNKFKEFAASVSIVINNDNDFPKNICHICLYKLEMWNEFKQQLINSNKLLLNILNSYESSNIEKSIVNTNNSNGSTNSSNFMRLNHESSQNNSHQLKALNFDVINTKFNKDETRSLFSSKTIKNKIENSSESKQSTPSIIKTRHLGVRRTNEQRMASTQRWVARKRALLAATGENDSDTDSINSDATSKLSSLKKPRKSFYLTTNEDNPLEPQTVQSELFIGEALFIVTSTLFLSDPPNIDRLSNILNLPMKYECNIVVHEQQNIDIMNALQLCHINTTNNYLMDDGKFVERCLNIEIEGTKLETLQKLQSELASFIQKDIKKKLINESVHDESTEREDIKPNESFQTLNQQLKVIVEKAIKKNLYRSNEKRFSAINEVGKFHYKKTFSNAFIKAAMKSEIFQPRVILNRLDLNLTDVENIEESRKLPKCSLTNLNCYKDQTCIVNIHNDHHYETSINSPKKLKNSCSLNEKTYIRRVCGVSHASQLQVDKHFNIHNEKRRSSENVEKKIMRCNKCDRSVKGDLIKTHICESFSSKYRHKCDKCDIIFCTESLSLNHKRIHQDDVQQTFKDSAGELHNSYSCFICDKNFSNDEILKEHLQRHCNDTNGEENNSINNSTKLYQCAICGYTLDAENKLENHVEKHLIDDADDNPNLVNIIQTNNMKHSSEIQSNANHLCLPGYDSKVIILESYQDDVQIQNGCRLCTICDLTFSNEQEFLKHLNIHNNASCVCMLCDQPFLSLIELEEHVNSH